MSRSDGLRRRGRRRTAARGGLGGGSGSSPGSDATEMRWSPVPRWLAGCSDNGHPARRWTAIGWSAHSTLSFLNADATSVSSDGYGAALEQQLGDLDCVQRRALAEVVADDEQDEAVLSRRIAAHASHEDLVDADGVSRVGTFSKRTPGASVSSRTASSATSSSCVSTHTVSVWPTSTGTRTHVALIGSSGRSRILRVSSRSLDSSSNSSPSNPSREVALAGRRGTQLFHSLRACTGHRLIRAHAHAREAGGVVQRLQRHRERDRGAVRIGHDAVVFERAVGRRQRRCLPGNRAMRKAPATEEPRWQRSTSFRSVGRCARASRSAS
jgi:hypothetical protein